MIKKDEGGLSLNSMDGNGIQRLCVVNNGCVGDDGGCSCPCNSGYSDIVRLLMPQPV